LLACAAVFARAVADSRIDDNGITRGVSSYAIADGVDDSGSVSAHDPRRCDRHAWQTTQCEQVEMIQRCSLEAYADVTRCRLGNRQIPPKLELFDAPVSGDRECSQRKSPGLY
jgi:hypothetical protein